MGHRFPVGCRTTVFSGDFPANGLAGFDSFGLAAAQKFHDERIGVGRGPSRFDLSLVRSYFESVKDHRDFTYPLRFLSAACRSVTRAAARYYDLASLGSHSSRSELKRDFTIADSRDYKDWR
jgi:hypothetical protein